MSEKRREEEPSLDFKFKDKYGEYKIPENLKQLCDKKFSKNGWILVYLTKLVHTASSQQANYKDGSQIVHYELQEQESEEQAVSGSSLFESVSKSYEGSQGMENFTEARDELIKIFGNEDVLQLESMLKVDSAGVDAKDENPLLGVDIKAAVALSHYLSKIPGC